MRKILLIGEEFIRSFQKSLIKNILLMVVFSMAILMAVIMSSYYLDLGEREEDLKTNFSEDGVWYKTGLEINDYNELISSLITAKSAENIMNYYEEIHHIKDHPVMSVNTEQSLFVKEKDVHDMFEKVDVGAFCSIDHPEGTFMAYYADEAQGSAMYSLKSAQFDYEAFQFYGLTVEEGEGFTKENTTLNKASDAVPIIMGNAYKDVVKLGQIFNFGISTYSYPCKVIGILDKAVQIPQGGNVTQDLRNLDNYIIFPFAITVSDTSKDVKCLEKHAYFDIVALADSTMIEMKDESEFRELVSLFQKIGKKYDLPPIQLNAASIGLDILRKESAASVQILLILTIVLVVFTFYGLFVTFYDKVQSNKRVYGIYLMNGCSMSMIIVPFVLEIITILVPSIVLCQYIFSDEKFGFDGGNIEVILRMVYIFAGFAILMGIGFLAVIMRGVDTEHLIRQKD